MTALLIYLELPRDDRMRLAESITARGEDSVRRDFDAHWISRAVKAISALGEGSVATLEGAVKAVRAMQAEAMPSHTPGSGAARREGAGHKSKRRRSA